LVLVASPTSAAPILFGPNAYEYVPTLGLSFSQATAAAQAATFNGVSGHLVTIFSAAENAFVASLITSVSGSAWIGASDALVEGEWRWVSGEQFWTGGPAGVPGPDVFFANWLFGQPDNFGSGQHVATMFGGNTGISGFAGRWDDGGSGGGIGGGIFQRDGYIVEFDNVAVPEPTTLLLFGLGFGALARRVRRHSHRLS
jgi:hypothetical protein